jgi:carboxymethylenebutenolidase|tara:strand:+ start:4711 stop:5457 length:747 start_codon:yes stop_codon:yes gene_type:complete
LVKVSVLLKTADGAIPTTVFHSDNLDDSSQRQGIILYMDAFGPRPALDEIADRLANEGYSVLVPDLFYRFGNYGPLDPKMAFSTPTGKDKIMSMIHETTHKMIARDTDAFLDFFSETGFTGSIGALGYCMGGGYAISAAAAHPERIVAVAIFHGEGLASDEPDSPHLRAGSIKARLYIGCAGVDPNFSPEQSARLAQELRQAGVDHIIENYIEMKHGWAVPDHLAFDLEGAERHWRRLLMFFGDTMWR